MLGWSGALSLTPVGTDGSPGLTLVPPRDSLALKPSTPAVPFTYLFFFFPPEIRGGVGGGWWRRVLSRGGPRERRGQALRNPLFL